MDSCSLRSVSDLPEPFRLTFSFRYFNSLQSECFSECYLSDTNMVISAPTGSGKTVLFELSILRLLSRFLTKEAKFVHIKGTLKTIYIAPSKALVQEKLRDWNQKLGSWGINCLELTSDSEFYNPKNLQEADIILTTPEKFDAVTRYRIIDGGLSFFSDIGLLLIDEVHLLNDPRGASLEAVVSRVKMLSRNPEMKSSPLAHVRFLAVSATIPNIVDLAEWLMVPMHGIKRFGEEMRPVKLTTKVFGYAPAKNDFLFERRLENYIFDILMQFSRGKSALVFCSTRKGAQEAALRLSQTAITFGNSNPFIKSQDQHERLKEASLSFSDKQMQSCILFGVGYHNGGLCLKDRNLIEGLFLRGDVQVLCTTNTLAHGINLPAHTVVIKSTQYFNKEKGLYVEYDRSMILQMCGRAGRPPFDDSGMVIIMTRRETVHLYENLLNGCEMVESQLLSCMTEHLAAEIVQLTISDISQAIEWMKCSYLYVRMRKHPENYAVKKNLPGECLEKHMHEICVQKANELLSHGMIWMDEYGFLLKPLEPARLMTKYYLKFNTMKHIIQTPENCSLEDVLYTICRSEEIAWIQLRRNEKKLLNDINTDKEGRLRFHIISDNGKRKKRIQTREEKIFLLANDCLTGDPSCHDLSLNQDMNAICSTGCRVSKCMKECFIDKRNYKGVMNSSLLAKCLHHRIWEDSPYLLRQLTGIGMVTAKALNLAGINSFETLMEADPRQIEIVTGRKYPFGNHVKESLSLLPANIDMKIEEIESQRRGKAKLVVTLVRLSQSTSTVKRHFADMIIGLEEDDLILFHEKIRVEQFSSPYSTTVLVSIPQQGKLTVKADLIFEEYVGLDLHKNLLLEKKIESNMINRNGNRKSTFSYDLPEDVYVVDDDNNTKTQTEEPHSSGTSNKDLMPSFQLLDEDIDEVTPAFEMGGGHETVSEKTVFDHIQRKSKDYPPLETLNSINGPASSTFLTPRKGPCGKRIEILSDETQTKLIQREMIILSDSEPEEQIRHISASDLDAALKNDAISRNSRSSTFLVNNLNEECPISGPEEERSEAVNKETIFDHIWKKSKNFPSLSTLNVEKLEPMMLTREQFCTENFTFKDVEVSEGNGSIIPRKRGLGPHSDAEPMEKHVFATSECAEAKYHTFQIDLSNEAEKPCLSSGISGTATDVAELKVQASYVLSDKEDSNFSGREHSGLQLKGSGNELNTQSCTRHAIGETREVVSFLGFKSVFSFL